MLSYSRRRDPSLLYLMKQQKDQTKRFDVFISFEIQIEKILEKARKENLKTKTNRKRK